MVATPNHFQPTPVQTLEEDTLPLVPIDSRVMDFQKPAEKLC